MRVLILTQAVDRDEPALAFFHRWIEEFARDCESVEVICLKEGDHALPANVRVHSLGKESGASRVKYLRRLYRYSWSLRRDYDAVFVHMNPEYVALCGLLWKSLGKRIVLWYTHKQLTFSLRVAVAMSDAVCTAAKESMRLESPKVKVVGHGIDTELFAKGPIPAIDAGHPRIVSVGRITPIKRLETAVEAIALLRGQGIGATLDLVGAATVDSDRAYEGSIRAQIRARGLDGAVSFLGSVKNADMPALYPRYSLSINACPTGGIDKAVLESAAAGVPALFSNAAFEAYFGGLSEALRFEQENPSDLARRIETLMARGDLKALQLRVREAMVRKADVTAVVAAIMRELAA